MSAAHSVQVAVSTVIFALRPHHDTGMMTVWMPLVRRIRDPYVGQWALPGGPLEADEDLAASAARTLAETTLLTPRYLEQLYAFGNTDRSPGDRVVSIVYWALVGSDEADVAVETENVRWFEADSLPDLAFDHNLIVDYALWRLRNKLEYSHIAHAFLGDTFTLSELREVHEAVLQKSLDPANFRRQIEGTGQVVPTEHLQTGGRHRPARLYRYNRAATAENNGPLGSRPSPAGTPQGTS
ncbi:MAG: NUDIX domain-containing protein [Mycetocola sp.]